MVFVATLMLPVSAFAAKTLKIGLGDPIDSDQGVLALRFKEIVEKTSGGKYKIDIFPAGQLGDEQKMVKDSRRDPSTEPLSRLTTSPRLQNPWVF